MDFFVVHDQGTSPPALAATIAGSVRSCCSAAGTGELPRGDEGDGGPAAGRGGGERALGAAAGLTADAGGGVHSGAPEHTGCAIP